MLAENITKNFIIAGQKQAEKVTATTKASDEDALKILKKNYGTKHGNI